MARPPVAREVPVGRNRPAGCVIASGHGRRKIALLPERLLAERGDQAVWLIRNPAQIAHVHKADAEAVICDLEAASADDVAALLSEADAVVIRGWHRSGR
jgi:NAD(P)H-binding